MFRNLDDHLVIHVDAPAWKESADYCLGVTIFWKRNSTDSHVLPEVFFSVPTEVCYAFANGILLKGTLEVRKMANSIYTHGVFADLYYYRNGSETYIWHTEGFLVGFETGTRGIPDTERLVIIEEPSEDPTEVRVFEAADPMVVSGNESDLFPYIYVSDWPKLNAAELVRHFFSYHPEAKDGLATSFPARLKSLKAAGQREAMQEAAAQFIEGMDPYESQYVSRVSELKGYLQRFSLFYDELLEVPESRVDLVDRTCFFFETGVEHFAVYLKSSSYEAEKERLWASYFALIIAAEETVRLEAIIRVLTLCNFLEIVFSTLDETRTKTTLNKSNRMSLLHATIVLDPEIFPLPPYPVPEEIEKPFPAILPYAIGGLQLVKYRLLRYEAGELASITNIMPGEKRKLVNRKLDRVVEKEVTQTVTTTSSDSSSHEHGSDFNEEMWNALAETTETTTYPGITSTYGAPTNMTITGVVTKVTTTQTPDKRQMSSFAKKVLSRTTQRLSEKIGKVRTHTELRESEDTSVSLFDNTRKKEAMYGMYCWLNKVYEAKVVHYGNRMLLSFVLPDPAMAYIRKSGRLDGQSLEEPKSPDQFLIFRYEDITQDNYLDVCQYYRLIDFPLPPQTTIVVSDVVGLSQSKLIALPDGYQAELATLQYAFGNTTTVVRVSGFIGQRTFRLSNVDEVVGSRGSEQLDGEQGTIPVGVAWNPEIVMSPPDSGLDFQLSVEISCTPLPQTLLAWKIRIYQLAMEAYAALVSDLRLKTHSGDLKKETENPLGQRQVIRQELEKGIRRQLLEQAAGDGFSGPVDAPSRDQDGIVRYLQQAIEWKELSYTFFEGDDQLDNLFSAASLSPDYFAAFLRSTCARVIVPVVPECNYGLLYFLKTGTIWLGEDRLAPCFSDSDASGTDQESVVYGLKKAFHAPASGEQIIDVWEVLVPTPMQILRSDHSSFLTENT